MQWFLRHSHIPLGILTDKGSVFKSKLIQSLSETLEFKRNHATVKHAQTNGLLERSRGQLKRYLKIYENELKNDWHKYVDLAVFQHNTSYHTVLGSPPTLIFHGSIQVNPIDIPFNNKTPLNYSSKLDSVSDLQTKLNNIFATSRKI